MLDALLGLIGGLCAAAIGAWATLRTRKPAPAKISLGDCTLEWVDEGLGKTFALADFTVRNSGGATCLITRIELHCPASLRFEDTPYPQAAFYPTLSALESSSITSVEMPLPQATAFSIDKKISQVIRGGDFDRFQVKIAMPRISGSAWLGSGDFGFSLLYRVRFEFKHDSEAGPLQAGWFALCYPDGPSFKDGEYVYGKLMGFIEGVIKIRSKIDNEHLRQGLAVIDWQSYANLSRLRFADLRWELESTFQLPDHGQILPDFWQPTVSLDAYFDKQITQLEKLATIIDNVDQTKSREGKRVPDAEKVKDLLDDLRRLRLELEERIVELGWRA